MIIVTGSITAKPGQIDEAWAFSTNHVARSRTEPGCISHHVFRDPDNSDRLFFFERWESMAALKAHFAVAGSREFSKRVGEVAAASELHIYEAKDVRP